MSAGSVVVGESLTEETTCNYCRTAFMSVVASFFFDIVTPASRLDTELPY